MYVVDRNTMKKEPTITYEQGVELCRDAMDEELWKALTSIGDDKAPGVDGYNAYFYKKTWSITKDDIEAQSGFIPGRKIADNIILATELVKAYSRQHISPRFMVNGETTPPFNAAKGLRQGDSISPYLFAIFMEYLSRCLTEVREFEGFKFHPKCGIMQLVQSVLFGIQAYWSQLFTISAKVLKLIESYYRSFTWSGSNTITKRALIAWEKVCLPKLVGGMNLINIRLWNQATIAKTCWDLAHKSDKLWIRWIHLFYVKNQQFFIAHIPKQASWMVKKILNARLTLEQT
ncbi:hypothetical protein MTR67_034270 [Solanum verrucosum]|uniref:Reverse transcriptase domain-containing protein n=1 Tax=Solanum verrucosum TaxID=315347 RepID=A0AAF0U7F3_SOLVR|nr:hypothetical protein MTR67_034270 [Solanum verrucosum]